MKKLAVIQITVAGINATEYDKTALGMKSLMFCNRIVGSDNCVTSVKLAAEYLFKQEYQILVMDLQGKLYLCTKDFTLIPIGGKLGRTELFTPIIQHLIGD